jgi:hypothetical protein
MYLDLSIYLDAQQQSMNLEMSTIYNLEHIYLDLSIYLEAKMQQGAFCTANAQTPWLQPITTFRLDQLQLCHHTNCNLTENHFVHNLSQLQMGDLH